MEYCAYEWGRLRQCEHSRSKIVVIWDGHNCADEPIDGMGGYDTNNCMRPPCKQQPKGKYDLAYNIDQVHLPWSIFSGHWLILELT